MSGGVDSSVTLRILKEMVSSTFDRYKALSWRDHDLTDRKPVHLHAFFMRNWDPQLSEEQSESEPSGRISNLVYRTPTASGTSTGTGSGKDDRRSMCEWERDWSDVQRVCEHVGIPKERVKMYDFTKEYWSRVFEPAVAVWEAGGTPNPDVACNR